MNNKMTALLIAIVCAPIGRTNSYAQEFIGQGEILQALGGFKFQAAKPGVPRQPADATAVVPRSIVPPKDRYPVRGIDVSHYQGAIEWVKVKRAEISFAYIKATEG